MRFSFPVRPIFALLLTLAGCHPIQEKYPPGDPIFENATEADKQRWRREFNVNPQVTVPFLASDKLAGRAPGTQGLDDAGKMIAADFSRIGLQPLPGMKDYFQPFNMPISSTLGPSTNLLVNDKSLMLNTDFSPISLTSEGPFDGKLVFAGYGITRADYDDYANLDVHGKVVLVLRQEPRDKDGKSRFAGANQTWSDGAYLGTKAKNAAAHGAVAMLLVNRPASGGADLITLFVGDTQSPSSPIPFIQVSRRVADMLLAMGGAKDLATLQSAIDQTLVPESTALSDVDVSGDVQLRRSSADVRNVIAYLPGVGPHADEYVVVGAHYDHLGTGQLGHMLGPTGSIYHGADDNASGTAAVIELAEKMKAAGPLPRSVILACFTAEEEGLIGSQYFVKHPPVPLEKIVAMLNLDMVGRLKDENLLVGGWGTAPIFDSMVKQAIVGLPLKTQSFEKGGLGPSDHMSFALHKIPVLFLFTGLHADYHRPTDTADKINYAGIDEVVTLSQRLIDAMAIMPRQQYDGSNDSQSTMAFISGHGSGRKASLGIVPDFGAPDATAGVPISGVSPATPAELAGLKGGDIITEFAGKPMNNLQDLSDALSQASPGDQVTVKVLRGGKVLEFHVTLAERKE
jgi:Peptidase family M28/PDZ domain/PA domain